MYSTEMIVRAVESVKKGESYRNASKEYDIPIATLFRKAKFPETIKKQRRGPPTILTSKEEHSIVDWILYRADTGCPVTKSELLNSVQTYLQDLKEENPFTNNKPGRRWLDAFNKRRPNISNITAQTLEMVRAVVTEDLRKWFSETESYLESKNLLDIPASRVFNCDESSIQLCPKPKKVFAAKGARTVYQCNDGSDKENYSVPDLDLSTDVPTSPVLQNNLSSNVNNNIPNNDNDASLNLLTQNNQILPVVDGNEKNDTENDINVSQKSLDSPKRTFKKAFKFPEEYLDKKKKLLTNTKKKEAKK